MRTREGVGGGGAGPERGFGLVETVIALGLMSVIVLGVGQMVVAGAYLSEASEDLTSVTALAADRLEDLRATDYDTLTPGGDITANVEGYYDSLDLDPTAGAEIVRRWQITDIGNALQIDVRVLGPANAMGENRDIRLTAIVAQK